MNYIKAKFFLTLIAISWGSLIIIMLPLMIVAYIVDRFLPRTRWLYSILLAQDHMVHAIMGGHFETTISSMLGQLERANSKTGTICANVVDKLFNIASGQTEHCKKSIQEGDKALFSARRAIAGSIIFYIGIYFLLLI